VIGHATVRTGIARVFGFEVRRDNSAFLIIVRAAGHGEGHAGPYRREFSPVRIE
jgi:hypothetical protein